MRRSATHPPAATWVCYRSGVDAIEEWTQAQRRVIELARSLSAEQAERQVPACPDWTVTQLLAHMVGLNADVLAGDKPEDHNAAWTQRQVDERADRDVAVSPPSGRAWPRACAAGCGSTTAGR